MTAKILTLLDAVVHCSKYRLLNPKELADAVEQDCTKDFLQTATNHWDKCLAKVHLEEVGIMDTPDA